MSLSTGALEKIGFGFQLVDQETEALQANILALDVETFNPGPQISVQAKNAMVGQIEANSGQVPTGEWAEPSITGFATIDQLPAIFKLFMGDLATVPDTPEAGVYTHTIKVAQSNFPAFATIVYLNGAQTKSIIGFMASQLELESTSNDRIKWTLSGRGRFPVDTALDVVHVDQIDLTTGDGCVEVDSSQVEFQRFKLTLSRPVLPQETICSLAPKKHYSGAIVVTGDGDIVLEDDTALADWKSQVVKDFDFNIVKSGVTIGLVTNPSFSINVARSRVETYSEDHPFDDKIMATWQLNAEKIPSMTDMITCVGVNEVDAY